MMATVAHGPEHQNGAGSPRRRSAVDMAVKVSGPDRPPWRAGRLQPGDYRHKASGGDRFERDGAEAVVPARHGEFAA